MAEKTIKYSDKIPQSHIAFCQDMHLKNAQCLLSAKIAVLRKNMGRYSGQNRFKAQQLLRTMTRDFEDGLSRTQKTLLRAKLTERKNDREENESYLYRRLYPHFYRKLFD